jgi:CubicO group peptidase (beta-lactamase class C family)
MLQTRIERPELHRGAPADVGMDPSRIELIRTRARAWVANGDTPSLVLLVARKGVIVLEEAYGILRPSDNAPLRFDSIFPVFSMSKPFTAAAVMCLVEDGLLSLKHPITDLLPEIKALGAEQVLVADLLTHTSGYDDMTVFPFVAPRFAEEVPVPDPAVGQHPEINRLIHYAADAPLTRPVGSAMCYCNFGYRLLGDIVRRLSGQPFAQFVADRVFAPAGMRDSHFVLPVELRRTRRVFRDPSYPDLPTYFPPPAFPPSQFPRADSEAIDAIDLGDGGAASTARDYAVFVQMLLNGGEYGGRRVLSRASVAAMTAPQLQSGLRCVFSMADPNTGVPAEYPIRGGNYGYGLFVLRRDDRTPYFNGSLRSATSFGHTGFIMSCFWADPEEDVVGVYLSVPAAMRPNGYLLYHGDSVQDMVHAAIMD